MNGGASWIVKQMLQLIGGRSSFADYEFADKRISQEAKVMYVLIRPAALKDKTGNRKYHVFKADGTFARPVEKEDVALFPFDALESYHCDSKGGFGLLRRN